MMGSDRSYSKTPWVFEGRALYQLQLVRSSEARKYIPDGLKLVDLFGYTLGGFYLARYDDSPAGKFDELVALAGLVWNPPTSCAWAARVYVNSRLARDHGIKSVGLPSRLASFCTGEPSSAGPGPSGRGARLRLSWWGSQAQPKGYRAPRPSDAECPVWPTPSDMDRRGTGAEDMGLMTLGNLDASSPAGIAVATFSVPTARSWWQWAGPRIDLSLPSFSGRTATVPDMLRYACRISANVRLCSPVAVAPSNAGEWGEKDSQEDLRHVLGGRPLLCMAFDNMRMEVNEPEVVRDTVEGGRTAQRAVALAAVAADRLV